MPSSYLSRQAPEQVTLGPALYRPNLGMPETEYQDPVGFFCPDQSDSCSAMVAKQFLHERPLSCPLSCPSMRLLSIIGSQLFSNFFLLLQFPLVLGTTKRAHNIDLLFIAYEFFTQLLWTQKTDITASTCRTLSLYFIPFLRHSPLL